MDVTSAFLTILIILMLGYLSKRFSIISPTAVKSFNNMVVYFGMPCLVFSLIYSADLSLLPQLGILPIVGLTTAVLTGIIGFIIYSMLKLKPKQKWALIGCVMMGNSAFIGFPVVNGVFGSNGLIIAIFFNITDTLMMVILYMVYIARFGGEFRNVVKRIIEFPLLWGLILGLIFNIYNIPVQPGILSAINYLKDITIPLIIFSLGLSIEFKGLLDNAELSLLASFLKLLIYPLICVGILTLFNINGFHEEISIIEASMSCAMLNYAYAVEFNLDSKLTSNTILISTLLSLITIPVIMLSMSL